MSGAARKRWNSGPTIPEAKKKKYSCKFQHEWKKVHSWIQPSSIATDMCFCTLCGTNFSVSSGGLYDVRRHSESALHKKAVSGCKGTPSLTNFLPTKTTGTLDSQVIRSEALFSNFVAEHNMAFAVADHFSELCKKMFPDSKIADKFACKRTKCTQIIKQAIAPDLHKTLIERCRRQFFTILCDESNDRGTDKCFAILVRIFEEESMSVKTRFLDMPIVNIGTGANLYMALDKCLRYIRLNKMHVKFYMKLFNIFENLTNNFTFQFERNTMDQCNWIFFRQLFNNEREEELCYIQNYGSSAPCYGYRMHLPFGKSVLQGRS